MSRVAIPRTSLARRGVRHSRALRRRLADDIRRAREDAGLGLRRVAREAGISHSTLLALEREEHDPSAEVLARVGAVLGLDLSMRFYPGTGPLIRDHLQARMIEALLGSLHERWWPTPEVWLTRPIRGVIDIVLDADDEPLVATEAQSELRRLEQQLRWSQAKAEALAWTRGRAASRLLLLRDTSSIRTLVTQYAMTISASYPAPAPAAFAALTGTHPWPGAAIIWCDVQTGVTRIRDGPPRGIAVGR